MKLVREYINEKFIEDSDPVKDLGIGIIQQIENWLEKYNVYSYTINDDGTIDVDTDVNFYGHNLDEFPDFIQFNKITNGFFSCAKNNLTSLRGCPNYVAENFYCYSNQLRTLKYMPTYVGGTVDCENNLKKFTIKELKRYCPTAVNYLL